MAIITKMDSETTISELKNNILSFVKERNWSRFQNIRSLAISMSLESNELLEHFQWFNDKEVLTAEKDLELKEKLGEELADVLAYVLIASDRLNLDLSQVFIDKMDKNRKKYPNQEFKDLSCEQDNKKYDTLRKQHLNKRTAIRKDFKVKNK